jgi:SAM-dependent methyltransferase
MTGPRAQGLVRTVAGLVDAARSTSPLARLALARDQAVVARHLFLAGAVRLGALPHLRQPRTAVQLAKLLDVPTGPRLEGWLALGAATGQLVRHDDAWRVHGRRARALAGGDALLTSWYRSLLDFGTGIPAELPELLRSDVDRHDLSHAADTIAALAEMSDAAFRPLVAEALAGAASLLDVGCGDGRLLAWALQRSPGLRASGIDQEPTVIALAATRLAGRDVDLRVVALEHLPTGRTYDVVVSANAVYYSPPAELPGQLAGLADRLAPGGRLVVGTALRPEPGRGRRLLGPVLSATALLDLQLRCQPAGLRLPTEAELTAAVAAAGLRVLARHRSLPGLPFLTLATASR